MDFIRNYMTIDEYINIKTEEHNCISEIAHPPNSQKGEREHIKNLLQVHTELVNNNNNKKRSQDNGVNSLRLDKKYFRQQIASMPLRKYEKI